MRSNNDDRGVLYGIGVGPGEPGLLTLKAFQALNNSDLIFIPRATPDKKSLAYEIIKEVFNEYGTGDKELPPTKDLIFPMKKDTSELTFYWEKATETVLEELNKNKKISLITLGDPTLYSTYCYILNQIKNSTSNHLITTIPGIYSFSAISSRLNLPLALGNEKIIVIPVEEEKSYVRELNNYDNIIFMKASANFDGLLEDLKITERNNEAILISKVGQKEEKVIKEFKNLKGKKIDYFSTLIVNPRIPLVGDKYAGQ